MRYAQWLMALAALAVAAGAVQAQPVNVTQGAVRVGEAQGTVSVSAVAVEASPPTIVLEAQPIRVMQGSGVIMGPGGVTSGGPPTVLEAQPVRVMPGGMGMGGGVMGPGSITITRPGGMVTAPGRPGGMITGPGAVTTGSFGMSGVTTEAGPVQIWVGGPGGMAPGGFAGAAEGPVTLTEAAMPFGPPVKKIMTYLGVAVSPAVGALADQLKLPPETGLVVDFVEEGSPAAKTGLKRSDVLTRFNDQMLINPQQFAVLVRLGKAKDKVTLTVIREGKEQKVPVELAEAERTVPGEGPPEMWIRSALPPQVQRHMGDMLYIAPPIPGGPNAPAVTSLTTTDGEHTLTITTINGDKHLTVKDRNGKVVFDGPINTDEQLKAVPEAIREKLKRMEEHTRINAEINIERGERRGAEVAPPAVESPHSTKATPGTSL